MAVRSSQLCREHIKEEHLAGKGLCRRDRALASAMREQVSSTMPVIDEPGSLVMPTVYAPDRRALSSTRLMSSPSPDCETPTTSAWSSSQLRVVDRVN